MRNHLRFNFLVLSLFFFLVGFEAPAFAEDGSSGSARMGKFRYGFGGVLGVYPGFGIGHAVQGRWLERGWMMTAGEAVGITLVGAGLAQCTAEIVGDSISGDKSDCNSGLLAAGLITFAAFKIWEVIDIWVTPIKKNMVANFMFIPATADRPNMLAVGFNF